MGMPGRNYSEENAYRYGFNGKENDNEVKGEGNQQDYGMRIYDPRLGRFLSVDPISHLYPMLTPYQFASNSPISGIDMDGLEFYYAADGKFLGQGKDLENKEVRLGKLTGKTKTNKNIISGVDLDGQARSQWMVIHNSHDDFKAMAGILYAEADGTTSEAVDEVAGIYSVLENRAKYEGTTVQEQMTVAKGVFGANTTEADKINQADKTGMTEKKEAVFSGLIKGILSETDFSGGAFFWDGKDFNKDAKPNGGYKQRYVPGFEFTDKSHDLFSQGNNLVQGSNSFKMGGNKTIVKTWDYKYQSTRAKGKTTFSKLTNEWRDAQHPTKKADVLGKSN